MMNEDGEEANPVLIYTSTFELRGVFVARRVESYSANTRGRTKPGQTKLSPSSLALGLGLVDLWTKRPTKTQSPQPPCFCIRLHIEIVPSAIPPKRECGTGNLPSHPPLILPFHCSTPSRFEFFTGPARCRTLTFLFQPDIHLMFATLLTSPLFSKTS